MAVRDTDNLRDFLEEPLELEPTRPVDPQAPRCLQILGLHRHCGEIEVRRAFRRRAKRAHPDVGGTQQTFIALRKAYEDSLHFVRTGEDRSRPAFAANTAGAAATAADPDGFVDPFGGASGWQRWRAEPPVPDPARWRPTREDIRRVRIIGGVLIAAGMLLALASFVFYRAG